MSENAMRFSENYRAHLLRFAENRDGIVNASPFSGGELLAQLDECRFAPSSMQSDETIPYVRLGKAEGHRPALYVPGFTEGIEAKAPTALALAKHRDVEIILPDQNRKKILKDSVTGKKDATYSQARNYMDVLQAEGLADQRGSVDIVTHSYGSLIFDAMHRIAESEQLPCFEGSAVIMTAPAGFNAAESLSGLAARFLRSFIAERVVKKDFLENDAGIGKEMFSSGFANAVANIPRTGREVLELAVRQVDYGRLLRSGIRRLAVVSFAEDVQFPDYTMERSMRCMLTIAKETGGDALWTTPVSLQSLHGDQHGPIRSGRDASHNDDQFNPMRVAGAVVQLLA